MRPTTRFSAFRAIPRILLAAALLGSAGAAHATACTVDSPTLLGSGLSNDGRGCGTDTSHEYGGGYTPPHEDGQPPHWNPPPPHWNGWHEGRYFKDGKECDPPVVPLPASSWLLVSGALALLAMGRRRHTATA